MDSHIYHKEHPRSYHHMLNLVSDDNDFFALYKCVNMVSTYNSTCLDVVAPVDEIKASNHLRCQQTHFVQNMTKHVYPLLDSCTHLSFPCSNSKNMTTRGSEIERLYFASVHATYRAFSFGAIHTIDSGLQTTNRNYSTLIHGVENRHECIALLEDKESVSFVRNASFPPLKTSVITTENIFAQNQIYDNSFAINSQRLSDESLVEMGKKLLSKIRKFAWLDISLNNLCVSIEVKQRRHLSFKEKVETLLFHEIMRYKCIGNKERFQEECSNFLPRTHDHSYEKYLFSCQKSKRQNPEMIDIYHLIPNPLQIILLDRWSLEGKLNPAAACLLPTETDFKLDLPVSVNDWEKWHICLLADEICVLLLRKKNKTKLQ